MDLHAEILRVSPRFLLSLRFCSGIRKTSVSSNDVSYIAGHLPSYDHHSEVCDRQNDPS